MVGKRSSRKRLGRKNAVGLQKPGTTSDDAGGALDATKAKKTMP